MEPSTDLRAGLAVLFVDEPRGRSVEEQVRAGRRRLRGRRVVMAAAAGVVAVAVASGLAVADRTPASLPPISTPTKTPRTVDPSVVAANDEEYELARSLVEVDVLGHLTARDGVEEIRRVDNYLGLQAPYTADGLEVRKGDAHFVYASIPGGGFSYERADEETLDQIVAERTSYPIQSYSESGPMPMNIWEWGADGLPIVLDPGIRVVRTVENPFHLDPPSRSVAMVLEGGAHRWWAYWKLGPSGYLGAMRSTEARPSQTLRQWLDIYDGDVYDAETAW